MLLEHITIRLMVADLLTKLLIVAVLKTHVKAMLF